MTSLAAALASDGGFPKIDEEFDSKFKASLEDPKYKAQLARLLEKVPVFADTTLEFRKAICQVCHVVEYKLGQVAFRQHEPGSWMGILLCGRLVRQVRRDNSSETKVGEVAPGGIVGDIGLLGISETRSVTVMSMADSSVVLVLAKQAFEMVIARTGRAASPPPDERAEVIDLSRHPVIQDARKMQNLMLDTEAICSLECFKRLDKDFVLRLCQHMEPRLYYPNQALMKENNYGNEMYILQAGQVKVEKGGKFLVKLSGGVVIGELAVLGADKRRTATVTSVTLSLCYVLNGDVFHDILNNFPHAKRVFDHAYISRLVTFELSKVKDEMSTLDQFYGRAHPMTTGEMMRKVYNKSDEDIWGGRARSPPQEKTSLLPRLPPTPTPRSKTAEPSSRLDVISRYPCKPPGSAPAAFRPSGAASLEPTKHGSR